MNNTTDPIHEALDRLASRVDTNPFDDPMPGIRRQARANRRRATALAAGGAAAVVVAVVGVAAAVGLPSDSDREPGFAETPKTPATSDTPPTTPSGPVLAAYDRTRADVDGDGADDVIRVMVPKADARHGTNDIVPSNDVRLRVKLAAGSTVELEFGKTLAPRIAGTPDLDGDGTADVVLSFSGGVAWLKVFTWDGDTVVQAEPAGEFPARLVDDGGLYTVQGGASAALADGGLISWVPTGDTSSPFEVRVWTWQLEGQRLLATEEEQLQCMEPGQRPEPC